MPRQVKVAILLFSMVLLVKGANNLWKIANDSEAAANAMFLSLWLSISLVAIALTGLFIYFSYRRRNWARIALLIWTVGSWLLWFVYPPMFSEYEFWKWAITATLIGMEFCALVLLFQGQGAAWYRSATVA